MIPILCWHFFFPTHETHLLWIVTDTCRFWNMGLFAWQISNLLLHHAPGGRKAPRPNLRGLQTLGFSGCYLLMDFDIFDARWREQISRLASKKQPFQPVTIVFLETNLHKNNAQGKHIFLETTVFKSFKYEVKFLTNSQQQWSLGFKFWVWEWCVVFCRTQNKERNRNAGISGILEPWNLVAPGLTHSHHSLLLCCKTGSIFKNKRVGTTGNKEQNVVRKTYHVHRRNKLNRSSPACPVEPPLPRRYWHNQTKNPRFQQISSRNRGCRAPEFMENVDPRSSNQETFRWTG